MKPRSVWLLALAIIILALGFYTTVLIDLEKDSEKLTAKNNSLQTQLNQTIHKYDSLEAAHKNCFPMSDLVEPLEKNHIVLTKKEYHNLMSQVARAGPRPMALGRELMTKLLDEESKYTKPYDTRVYKLCPIDSILTKDSTQQK